MKLSPLVSFYFLFWLRDGQTALKQIYTWVILHSVAESPKQATERCPTSQAQTRFAPAQVQGRWSVHVRKREGLDGCMGLSTHLRYKLPASHLPVNLPTYRSPPRHAIAIALPRIHTTPTETPPTRTNYPPFCPPRTVPFN